MKILQNSQIHSFQNSTFKRFIFLEIQRSLEGHAGNRDKEPNTKITSVIKDSNQVMEKAIKRGFTSTEDPGGIKPGQKNPNACPLGGI